jgi:hypothetical protein
MTGAKKADTDQIALREVSPKVRDLPLIFCLASPARI